MIAGHMVRLGVVAAVAWLVHATHAQQRTRRQAVDLATVPLALGQRCLPQAVAIGGGSAAVAGGREVSDAAGQTVGTILRTSPAADCVIGYQRPSDAVVGFDNATRVVGVAILGSYDNEPYYGEHPIVDVSTRQPPRIEHVLL